MAKSVTRLALLMARAAAFAVAVPLRRSFLPAAGERVEAPLAGHALELREAAFLELDSRARHEVLHRARDQHLTGRCHRRHAGPDVNRDAPDLPFHHLALAGVQPEPPGRGSARRR